MGKCLVWGLCLGESAMTTYTHSVRQYKNVLRNFCFRATRQNGTTTGFSSLLASFVHARYSLFVIADADLTGVANVGRRVVVCSSSKWHNRWRLAVLLLSVSFVFVAVFPVSAVGGETLSGIALDTIIRLIFSQSRIKMYYTYYSTRIKFLHLLLHSKSKLFKLLTVTSHQLGLSHLAFSQHGIGYSTSICAMAPRPRSVGVFDMNDMYV